MEKELLQLSEFMDELYFVKSFEVLVTRLYITPGHVTQRFKRLKMTT